MPGKEIKLIEKALHADGYYYIASVSTSEAATLAPKRPHIKISFRFDKGLIIGSSEQRDDEKLIRELEEQEQAAPVLAKKEEIPTPGFVLLKKEEVEDDHYTSSSSMGASTSSFQSKLDATKRKMHDSYQQLANAKKQRRIQVIDLPPPPPPPPPTQSSSKGKGATRKKMSIISTTNRKTRNFFNGRGVQSKLLVKPTSIF